MIQTIQNYVLNAPAKTITLTDFSVIYQERVKLIVDTTNNTILYNFADPSVSTCTVSSNVITLSTLPNSVVNGHALAVSYDTLSIDPRADTVGVTLDTSLTQAFDSILTYPRGSNFTNRSTSGSIMSAPGKFTGLWVSSASASPTIKIWDSLSATGTVIANTFTPVAGTFYNFPHVRVTNGVYITIGGTVDCTGFFDPTTT